MQPADTKFRQDVSPDVNQASVFICWWSCRASVQWLWNLLPPGKRNTNDAWSL